MRGGRGGAVLLCVVAGAVLLLAGGRAWLVADVPSSPPLPPVEHRLTGADLSAVRAAGVVALAGAAALALARPLARLLVGAFLLFLAVAAGSGPLGVALDPARSARRNGVSCCAEVTAWPWAALAASAALAVAGVLALLGVRRWADPARRHEREDAPPADLWSALEAGQDPTAEGPSDPHGRGREGGPTLPS